MDPATLITVLALQLVCTGGLLCLIGHHLPRRQGIGAWGVGGIAFGGAYFVRLHAGMDNASPFVLVLDGAMFVVSLLLLRGLRQFIGRSGPQLGMLVVGAAAYVVVAVAATALFGVIGRHVLLNGALAVAYLWTAGSAAAESRRGEQTLRTPLRAMALLIGLLGVATALRIVVLLRDGPGSLYAGRAAEIYYAISALAAILLGPVLLWMLFVRLNAQLADLAMRDALTRLLNRNGLDDAITRHFASRTPASLTLLQIDIDHFKRVNDTHGHTVGDHVLAAVAGILAAHVRGADFVARTGGEEFLIGCAGADARTAATLAERVRAAVADAKIVAPTGALVQCTVSIGVSHAFKVRGGWDGALKDADDALYAAKRSGRNRVMQRPIDAPNLDLPTTILRSPPDSALRGV